MHLRYRISEDEFAEASLGRSVLGARTLKVLGCFFVLVAAGQLILKAGPLYLAIAPAALAVILFSAVYGAKHRYRQDPRMKNDFEMQIGDPGLTITTDDISASVGWEAFREFRETKNLFLLYQTPALVQILPKQAFTSDEQAHFREMAIQKVPLRLRSARAQTVRMIVFFAVVIVAFVLLFQTLRNIH